MLTASVDSLHFREFTVVAFQDVDAAFNIINLDALIADNDIITHIRRLLNEWRITAILGTSTQTRSVNSGTPIWMFNPVVN